MMMAWGIILSFLYLTLGGLALYWAWQYQTSRRQFSRMNSVVENLPIGLVVLDRKGGIELVNGEIRRAFKKSVVADFKAYIDYEELWRMKDDSAASRTFRLDDRDYHVRVVSHLPEQQLRYFYYFLPVSLVPQVLDIQKTLQSSVIRHVTLGLLRRVQGPIDGLQTIYRALQQSRDPDIQKVRHNMEYEMSRLETMKSDYEAYSSL